MSTEGFPMSEDNSDDFSFPDDEGSDDFDFDAMDEDGFGYEFENEDSDGVGDIEVQISNCYYTSKGIIDEEPAEALQGFKQLLDMEAERGEWGFKALKQIVRLEYALKKHDDMLSSYKNLLSYVKSAVARNVSEKAITGLLERISGTNDYELLRKFFDMTLQILLETKNERFWFRTKQKVAKIQFEKAQYAELAELLVELEDSCKNGDGSVDMKKGTQLLEIYALKIQMYTVQKKTKKLRELYEKSLLVQSAIPHPRIMAVIRECGGKMHMQEECWEEAQKDFFEAFKNYDEAGSNRRIQCLKYMVLANLISLSEINPFGAPETASYKNDPQVVAMTDLVAAFENNDIKKFDSILKNNKESIAGDSFIGLYLDDLIKNIRTQVLLKMLRPYTRVSLSFVGKGLDVSEKEAEYLLVHLILEEKLNARIDQMKGIVVIDKSACNNNNADGLRYSALSEWSNQLATLTSSVIS